MYYKTTPLPHQIKGVDLCKDRKYFALFCETGTGKTKITIDKLCYSLSTGDIDCVLILAPNMVHYNWVAQELPKHMWDGINATIFEWGNSFGKKYEESKANILNPNGKPRIAVLNVEAISKGKLEQNKVKNCTESSGLMFCHKFIRSGKCLFIIDESSRIKSPSAQRTKNAINLGKLAEQRLILSGTPITQSPLDAYAQCKFLHTDILKCQTFTAFKHEYCVLSSRFNSKTRQQFDEIVSYKNIERLKDLLAPHSYRVTKEECLDLPEKIYEKYTVKLTPVQRKHYDELCNDLITEVNNKEVTTPIILTKLLRLQQITGGFIKADDDTDVMAFETSPKLNMLSELVEDIDGKIIIWARFTAEIKAIAKLLREQYGVNSVVEFWGEISQKDRANSIEQFQNNPVARFFVGNAHSGGIGLTLTAATTMIYYSNDFSLETRLQSEDRAHRIGQKNNVLYIDLIAENTIDEKVIEALRGKQNIANLITGDSLRKWI